VPVGLGVEVRARVGGFVTRCRVAVPAGVGVRVGVELAVDVRVAAWWVPWIIRAGVGVGVLVRVRVRVGLKARRWVGVGDAVRVAVGEVVLVGEGPEMTTMARVVPASLVASSTKVVDPGGAAARPANDTPLPPRLA
jgi:hypothetical protein